MQELIDFTNCEINYTNGYDGSNGTKICIIYNGKYYLLKIPETTDKYSNGAISEYISCNIYNKLGIKAQKTLLGFYETDGIKRKAVACEDFILNEKEKVLDLIPFASFKNQITNSSSNGYGTELEDIENTIAELQIMNSKEIDDFFWDMFIVDSLLGNFDRHNGNWGFLVDRKTKEVEFAPIYDCGSCLYPALSEESMKIYLEDKNFEELYKRIYVFPNSAIKINKAKINYYEFINSLENKNCNEALKRIYPRIKMDEILEIVDNTPGIGNTRKLFYKVMINQRYEKILKPAFEKLK